ncbi:MAG: 50S ribosomal protein L5 [Candidatus Buchananbacteria bacterium]|jgi:large subunit ribosomal protein L5
MESRLHKKYQKEVVPALKEKFGYKNIMSVPKILKVTINVGINSRNTDSGLLDNVENNLRRITGQKPVRTKSRAAISAFKVKENMVVGVVVTLRGQKMYDFLDKLINISLPRIRDFRGVSAGNIDQQGNMSIGFKEHVVFPEIRSDEVERIHGMQVNITTNSKSHEEGEELFRLLGFPMQKKS